MLGYLIYRSNYIEEKKVEKLIANLITFDQFKVIHSKCHTIVLFRNSFKNNYYFEEQNYIITSTGTIISENLRGEDVLRYIINKLYENVTIDEIYKELYGHFNLIIYFKKYSKLNLITDREGLQSGFEYHINEKENFFSSNLILLAALVKSEINSIGIRDFIHTGTTFENHTIFRNIKKLSKATKYSLEDDTWKDDKLWELKITNEYLHLKKNEISKILNKKIERKLSFLSNINENQIICDLSGGHDSRTILSYLLNKNANVIVNVAGPKNHEDVLLHKKISKKFNLKSIWYEDPFDNFSVSEYNIEEATEIADGCRNVITIMPAISFYKQRGENYTILMGGNGGPLFKDHYWLFEFNRINKKREPNWFRIANLSTIDYPWNDDLFKDENKESKSIANIYLENSKKIIGTNNQKLDYIYFNLKLESFTAPHITTANQFYDIYQPLCDGHLVDFSINIEPYLRKKSNLLSELIYNNNMDLAWIPTTSGAPAVPMKGRYFYLNYYVVLRYLKAIRRKIGFLLFKKNVIKPVYNISSIYDKLVDLDYTEELLNYEKMKTSYILDKISFLNMKENPLNDSNLDYLLNILSLELTFKRKNQLEKIV